MATYPKIPAVMKTSQRRPRLRVKVNTSIPISVSRYMTTMVGLWVNGAHTKSNNVEKSEPGKWLSDTHL